MKLGLLNPRPPYAIYIGVSKEIMTICNEKAMELKQKVGLAMSIEECEDFVGECMNEGREMTRYLA